MSDTRDIKGLPRFKPGDVIHHSHLNAIVDALKSEFQVRGPGVRQHGRRVQILPTITQQRVVALATADGAISAMSGATPGEGTASIQWFNNQTGNIEDSGESVQVINPAHTSSNGTGVIRDGQMCLAFWDPFGSVILVPIEC